MDLGILGLPAIVSTGVLTADVTCPVGGGGTAAATSVGVQLLGQSVTVTAALQTRVFSVLGVVDASASIQEIEDATGPNRAASIVVNVTLDLPDIPLPTPPISLGSIVLADARCSTPTAADPVTITNLTPNVGPTAGGTTVDVTGTNFVAGTTVTVGGNPATNVDVTSVTQLSFDTPAGAAGPADVVINNGGGDVTLAGGFTYVAPPTTATITPNAGPTAGGTRSDHHRVRLRRG